MSIFQYKTPYNPQNLQHFDIPESLRDDPSTYDPAPELADALNVALALGQPLLLTGDPGTGKTQLAYHIAHCFPNLKGPHRFTAQTTSVKKDLFYAYDALGHFRWAQNRGAQPGQAASDEDVARFITYQGLGEAIRLAQTEGQRSIVLIDEIDKAPRDLPNDLLDELDKFRFEVPELPSDVRWECPPNLRPVVVITSNSEKNLPDAFLRRVVFHHIEFPKTAKLLQILQKKKVLFPESKDNDQALAALVKHFEQIRDTKNLSKLPATAELVAWAALLSRLGFPAQHINDPAALSDEDKRKLQISYAALAKSRDDKAKLA